MKSRPRPAPPSAASRPLARAALLLCAALLAASPRASAGCCPGAGSGDEFAYGTNTFGAAGCSGLAWLEPQHDVAGSRTCGCEVGHAPQSVVTCCDRNLTVEWTKECVPVEGASVTVFTGHVYLDGEEVSRVTLRGRVFQPRAGCRTGCGGGDAQQHGKAVAASPRLDHRLALGPDSGFLRIRAERPSAGLATPECLGIVRGTRPVDVVCQGTPPMPRQVLSGSGLADIQVESPTAYRVDFYLADDVLPELGGEGPDEGLYVVRPGRSAHASWRVSNPTGDTNDVAVLTIVGGPAGPAPATNAYRYAEIPAPPSQPWRTGNSWTLGEGGVEDTVTITRTETPDVEIREFVRAPAGRAAPADRAETWFAPTNGLHAILSRVDDPEGLALQTRWTYATNDLPIPRLLFTQNPDGSWELPGYDASGRVASFRRPLGNAWTNAPDSALSLETNAYASVDANDTGGWEWSDRPRTVSAYEAGILVSRTYHAYYRTAGGERVEILERAATPSAAYGDPGNLRTKRTWFAESPAVPWSDEPRFVESPGGIRETHAYEAGVLDASDPDPALWSFVPDATGLWVRATATHGTADSPDGVPGRTLREVSVRDAFGRALLEEAWACSGPSNFARLAWTATARDALGRATSVRRSDGALSETAWSCCGPESETGPDGVRGEYAYDALGRRVLAFREGLPGVSADRYTATACDVHGGVLSESVAAGGLALSTTNAYDALGRLVWTRGPDGVETATLHGSNSTATVRGHGTALATTNLAVRLADGRVHYTAANGVRKATYAYGANADGTRWTTVFEGPLGDASPAWTKTTADFLGRTLLEERPGFGGTVLVTSNAYDTAGHLVATTTGHTAASSFTLHTSSLFSYDSLGERFRTTQDIDLDGETDLAGPDRVAGSETTYESDPSGDWWRVSRSWTYPGDGSAAPFTNAVARTRLTGLGVPYAAPPPGTPSGDWLLASESVSLDALGNATVGRALLDRAARRTLQCTDTPASTLDAWTLAVDGLSLTNSTATGVVTAHAYDALGRRVLSETLSGSTGDRRVAQSTAYNALGQVSWSEDALANRTSYGYDALGRRTSATDPLDQTTHTAYDAEGRAVATWGATYPVAYEYDPSGRMAAMATTRDTALDFAPLAAHLASGQSLESFASFASLDLTRWLYHEPTGLLTNKVYADGKGTAYTYTPDGRLASRLWSRGVSTSYSYAGSGELLGIAYSDATASVAFDYDRLGRQTSAITAGVSTNLYAYSLLGHLTNEVSCGRTFASAISRSHDALGRPVGIALSPLPLGEGQGEGSAPYAATYGYDEFGRFQSVQSAQSADTNTFTYSYVPNADLVSGMTASSGHAWLRAYEENRNLITSVENTFGETVVSRFDYSNDALGRRVSRADSGLAFEVQPTHGDPATTPTPAFNAYGYNARSEVNSAARRWGTPAAPGDSVLGQQYAYEYDPIGNRVTAAEGDSTRTAGYAANALNQYTQRTVPDEKDIVGTAPTNVAVAVNANPGTRQGAYWHHALEVDNAASAAYPQVEVAAAYNPAGTNDPDQVSTVTGRVFVAQTPETFQYDDDGNLRQDGRFTYSWDGENRLVAVTTRDDLSASVPRVKVEYVYDHQFRRIASSTSIWTNEAWQASTGKRFLYDGWNLVRETIATQQSAITNSYTWGLDLSQSLQGAGGIGGLLSDTRSGAGIPPATYFPCFDGNGNVSEYNHTEGVVVAHYEYDAFGRIIAQSGELAGIFAFRFSTKYFAPETGLYYYGHRYYSPALGRWLNRDPIGERGGLSLYSCVRNDNVCRVDVLGLKCAVVKGPTALPSAQWEVAEFVPTAGVGNGIALIEGFDIVWELEGKVECCCSWWIFTWTKTNRVHKKVEVPVSFEALPGFPGEILL